jgi:hypothetical protein
MLARSHLISVVPLILAAASAHAETMRSNVALNSAIQTPSAEQPADGVAVDYPVTLSGGELDGCEAQIAESLFPRDDGAWGIFAIEVEVTCDGGSFRFMSSGAWDGNGFHGAGRVVEDSGTGIYEGLSGRIAQIGGQVVPAAAEGTLDVSYELLVDREAN